MCDQLSENSQADCKPQSQADNPPRLSTIKPRPISPCKIPKQVSYSLPVYSGRPLTFWEGPTTFRRQAEETIRHQNVDHTSLQRHRCSRHVDSRNESDAANQKFKTSSPISITRRLRINIATTLSAVIAKTRNASTRNASNLRTGSGLSQGASVPIRAEVTTKGPCRVQRHPKIKDCQEATINQQRSA